MIVFMAFALAAALPDAKVFQPLPRDNMPGLTSTPPCGGVPKGKSHLLSQSGAINRVAWTIIEPAEGLCVVKLIYGSDYSMQHTLYPMDSNSTNGSFPCGGSQGIDSRLFQFPAGLSCDSCTLQWIWETPQGTLYQCFDIEITDEGDSSCYGRCKNTGFCSEGQCICVPGYSGTFCELDGRSHTVHVLYLFILFIALFVLVVFLALTYFVRFQGKTFYTVRLFYNKVFFCCPSE